MSQSAASIAIATLEAYDHIKLFDWGPSPLFNQCDAFDGSGVSVGVRAPLPDADIASTAFRDGQL
jgi:hypothetical protein